MTEQRPFKITTAQRFISAAPVMVQCREYADDYIDRLEAYLEVKQIRLPHKGVTQIGWKASDREFMLRVIMNLISVCKEIIKIANDFQDQDHTVHHRKSLIRFFVNHPLGAPKFYAHIIWHEDIKPLDAELYTIIQQKREEMVDLRNMLGNIM